MASIYQIIAKVNPELYALNWKELLKIYGSAKDVPADKIKANALVFNTKGNIQKEVYNNSREGLEAKYSLIYDSPSESLEPNYFFILDLMNDLGLDTKKVIDSFSSSPGSGHFSELGQRATIMQQQGIKLLGDVNAVSRSVLNLTYDLKELRGRLKLYDDLKDPKKSSAASLSLKQLWMDKVDINKGNSSIKAMSFGQAGFGTLIDAFLITKDEKLKDEDGNEIDLNETVKRILKPRILEFNIWVKQSEKEIRNRYAMEKDYLKSQVNSLKLYSKWAKPYLLAATSLQQKEQTQNPELVNIFNTLLLELTLLSTKKISLPPEVSNLKIHRDYYSCIVVDLRFRGIPQKIQQSHYAFGGRAEVTFKAYALNKEELDLVKKELNKSDLEDVLKLVEGSTSGLKSLQEDIDFFLEDKKEEEKKEVEDKSNPFLALFGNYEKKSKKIVPKKSSIIKKDNWVEKTYLREVAAKTGNETAFNLFDVYKKAHGMPSYT